MASARTGGQLLDLDRDDLAPPELGDTTYVQARLEVVQADLTQLLAVPQPTGAVEDQVLRARINIHRIVLDLLERGQGDEAERPVVILAALRLDGSRSALSKMLQTLLEEDADLRLTEAQAALSRFNRQAMRALERIEIDDPGRFDATLRTCLDELAETAGLIGQETCADHWLGMSGDEQATTDPTFSGRLARLEERLAEARLTDAPRQAVQANLEVLRRGLEFEEFRAQAEAYVVPLESLLDFCATLSEAAWLEPGERERYEGRISRAAELFSDPERRAQAISLIERLALSRTIFDLMNELAGQRADLRSLRRPFADVEALMDDPRGEDGAARLARLQAILQGMIDYRALDRPDLPRELRQVRKALQDSYDRTEAMIIDNLDRYLADERLKADPAASGLLHHQRGVVVDLDRLNRMQSWLDAVGRLRSRAQRIMLRRIRIVAGWLTEPGRRDAAAVMLDDFESDLERFERLPLEGALRNSLEVATLCGGLQDELAQRIVTLRSQWLNRLGSDLTGGEAADDLEKLHRLLGAMDRMLALKTLEQDLQVLNRWAAWWLDGEMIARPPRELPHRFKLAVAEAVRGKAPDLEEQLDIIERDLPSLELIAALAEARRSDLASLPGGIHGTLCALTVEPGTDAWLIEDRALLATLCRYICEREHARATGQREIAASVDAYVNGQSARLGDLIERHSTLEP